MKGVVNIFITADMDQRIQAVCNRHGCDRATARKIITSKEDQRSSYYNYYTGQKWGNAENYHLCINSSVLGIEGTAEFIKRFIKNEEDRNNK
jgi:cytidylate kinase